MDVGTTSPQPSTSTGITHTQNVVRNDKFPSGTSSESEDSDSGSNDIDAGSMVKRLKTSQSISWSKKDFRPFIHPFDELGSGPKTNLNAGSSILDFFFYSSLNV